MRSIECLNSMQYVVHGIMTSLHPIGLWGPPAEKATQQPDRGSSPSPQTTPFIWLTVGMTEPLVTACDFTQYLRRT